MSDTLDSKVLKAYKRQRMQTFLAATFGYALYYVCRLSMGVMKQPLIDAGLLSSSVSWRWDSWYPRR